MKKKTKYIPLVLIIVVSCLYFYKRVDDKTTLAIGDYIINFFKGEIPYVMTSKEKPFDIPALLAFYIMYFALIISWKISSFFTSGAYQKVIRLQSRKRVHMHHISSLFQETFAYWMLTYVIFLLFALCSNARFVLPDSAIQLKYSGIDISNLSAVTLGIHLIILPFVILVSIAFLQYAITLLTSTIISFVLIAVLLVASVFYFHPLLFGNYLMVIRHEAFLSYGARWEIGIFISLIIIVISFQFSYLNLRKKDLF